jgi:hypothetical protein
MADEKFVDVIAMLEPIVQDDAIADNLRQPFALALYKVGRLHESLAQFNLLADRYPNRSEFASNLATVLLALGHEELAFRAIERALALNPANVVAMQNLAEILQNLGNWQDALEAYKTAVALAPTDAKIRMQHGMCLVALGEWKTGWEELEYREQVAGVKIYPEPVASPRWHGDIPLAGRHLVIAHEQGLGDAIMCARFAKVLVAQGATVHLRTQETLVPLLSHAEGVTTCTPVGSPMPEHDFHIPLMSLPAALRLEADHLTGAPYLSAPGECPGHIAELLPAVKETVVAISWSGNPSHSNDRRRSINGALLAPLLETPGIRFVALQKFPPIESVLPEPLREKILDVGVQCRNFVDSAHALQRVDAMISVDSATAHLAGALGVPTFVCLPFRPDYRWGVRDQSTPWYRAVTLMRQPAPHAWDTVLATLVEKLSTIGKRST